MFACVCNLIFFNTFFNSHMCQVTISKAFPRHYLHVSSLHARHTTNFNCKKRFRFKISKNEARGTSPLFSFLYRHTDVIGARSPHFLQLIVLLNLMNHTHTHTACTYTVRCLEYLACVQMCERKWAGSTFHRLRRWSVNGPDQIFPLVLHINFIVGHKNRIKKTFLTVADFVPKILQSGTQYTINK